MTADPYLEYEISEASDAEAMATLRVEAMKESLEAIGRFDPVRARQRFLSSFDPKLSHHLVVQGHRVGLVVVRPIESGLLLDHLYVKPSLQGRGIGSKVLQRLFASADAGGLSVRVGALVKSRANQFYLRHGFILVEETTLDNYYVRYANGGLY
jgi:GNAT superfamily N-acetyltransferase